MSLHVGDWASRRWSRRRFLYHVGSPPVFPFFARNVVLSLHLLLTLSHRPNVLDEWITFLLPRSVHPHRLLIQIFAAELPPLQLQEWLGADPAHSTTSQRLHRLPPSPTRARLGSVPTSIRNHHREDRQDGQGDPGEGGRAGSSQIGSA